MTAHTIAVCAAACTAGFHVTAAAFGEAIALRETFEFGGPPSVTSGTQGFSASCYNTCQTIGVPIVAPSAGRISRVEVRFTTSLNPIAFDQSEIHLSGSTGGAAPMPTFGSETGRGWDRFPSPVTPVGVPASGPQAWETFWEPYPWEFGLAAGQAVYLYVSAGAASSPEPDLFICETDRSGSFFDVQTGNSLGGGGWRYTSSMPSSQFSGQVAINVFFTPNPPPSCADLNGDNRTNTADLVLFLGAFGTSVTPGTRGDLNSDGVVNVNDLTAFLGAFGVPCP